jgi:hypothetical protein
MSFVISAAGEQFRSRFIKEIKDLELDKINFEKSVVSALADRIDQIMWDSMSQNEQIRLQKDTLTYKSVVLLHLQNVMSNLRSALNEFENKFLTEVVALYSAEVDNALNESWQSVNPHETFVTLFALRQKPGDLSNSQKIMDSFSEAVAMDTVRDIEALLPDHTNEVRDGYASVFKDTAYYDFFNKLMGFVVDEKSPHGLRIHLVHFMLNFSNVILSSDHSANMHVHVTQTGVNRLSHESETITVYEQNISVTNFAVKDFDIAPIDAVPFMFKVFLDKTLTLVPLKDAQLIIASDSGENERQAVPFVTLYPGNTVIFESIKNEVISQFKFRWDG